MTQKITKTGDRRSLGDDQERKTVHDEADQFNDAGVVKPAQNINFVQEFVLVFVCDLVTFATVQNFHRHLYTSFGDDTRSAVTGAVQP